MKKIQSPLIKKLLHNSTITDGLQKLFESEHGAKEKQTAQEWASAMVEKVIASLDASEMKKGPTFTLEGMTITETRTGKTGEVVKDESAKYGFKVVVQNDTPDTQGFTIAKKMSNWYYYKYVRKEK